VVIAVYYSYILVRQIVRGEFGPGALGEDFQPIWAAATNVPFGPTYAPTLAEFAQHPGDPLRQAAFSYPPIVAVLVKPLAFVSFPVAETIWLALGLAFVALTWWIASRWLLPSPATAALALLFTVIQSAVWWNLEQGNMNVPIVLLSVGGVVAAIGRRFLLAGVLIGMAAALKGYPAVLLLPLLLQRQFLAAAIGAAVGGVLTLAGLLLGGSDSSAYFLRVLPAQLAGSAAEDNYSLSGVAHRLLEANVYHSELVNLPLVATIAPAALAVALLAASALLPLRLGRQAAGLAMLNLLAALPLVVTTGWVTTVLFAMPAASLMLALVLPRPGDVGLKAVLAFGLVLTSASPLARLAVYGIAGTARAIQAHDLVYVAWSLDVTTGCFLLWLGLVMRNRLLLQRG
jgi:hypothetical protein